MSQPASQPVPWDGEDYPNHPDPRARTVNNLKFMGLAMHNFAASNGGRLPAAAIFKGEEALLSWRVAILPFLEEFALFEKFHLDEAWDSPHNASLLKEMPNAYRPVAPEDTPTYSTYYQAFVGPGSLFDGEEGKVVADVASPTVMIVEAAEPVPWTKPEDLPYDETKPLPKLGRQFEDGFFAVFADGWPRFLSREVAPETIRSLIRRGDGDPDPPAPQ